MKKLPMDTPWVPHYPGDFAKHTMFFSTETVGAYCLIQNAYLIAGGPIPSDRFKIAKIIRTSPQKAKKILKELSPFFEEVNGVLVNKRIDIELAKVLKKRETAIANGRAGGMAKARATGVPSHSHSQNNNKRESRKVSEEFYPNEETKEFLRFRNITFDKKNVDIFIQHYIAKDNHCNDWEAKFRQWMLREKQYINQVNNNESNKRSCKDVFADGTKRAFD